MLDKLLGVSPTQKGLAQDSKVADQKNLQPDFKRDFERQLQKKLDTKSNSSKENENKSKAREKEEVRATTKTEDELRADRKQKKPSGEIKKKMVEPEKEETIISNVMALPKNEFEIPDQEEDLAMIESNGNSEKSELTTTMELTGAQAQSDSVTALDLTLSQKLQALSVDQQPVDALDASGDLDMENLMAPSESQLQQTELLVNSAEQEPVEMQKLSLEEELGQDVGFQSDLKRHVAESGFVQKMKEFESTKGLTGEKAQDFEQKVLQQLQQDKSALAAMNSQAQQSDSESSSSSKDQGSGGLNDLQAEPLKPDANFHLGQTHSDFKAHLASPIEKAGTPTAMEQLMEKRDENVQEIMKQAKFLAIEGGGEMTVKMSPDGMGEIQLKVLMQDGKLSIDMQTQDKSVKKLIEDSLSELKSGLAAQQVHVEHVKITTVNATNTDNSAQMQMNQDQSGAQQQKDFWKNFQDNFGNQSRRSSYGDVAAVGSPSPGEPAALQPIRNNGARNYGRTGSTINRVA